jgi:fructose-1-phosphate kinase PfkB-like protein
MAMGFRQLSRAAEAALELGTEQVVATLGVGGCRVFSAQGALRVPPCEVRPVDTAGADEAFVSGYIFGLLNNAPPEVCGVIANAAGAAAAGSLHLYESLSRDGLVLLLREGENRARRKKHAETIRKAIELLSKRGHTRRKKSQSSKSKNSSS